MSSSVARNLSRLGKDTFFYGMGSALQKFIGFFLFPIYTRVLSQEAFGTQDLVLTAVTITSYFLILGLDSGTARNYYDAETASDRQKIVSTYLFFELLISLPVSIALIIFSEPICVLLFRDSGLASYFRLAMASLPFTLIAGVTLLVMRLTFRSKAFAFTTATGVLIQAVASIYLVVILQMGVMGIFWASMLASVFRAVLGMGLTYKNFGLSFSMSWLKHMLSFGLPLVPASISLWIMNYSNRYFLVRLGTLNDIGLLSVGSRVASIVIFVVTAFRTAWGPFAYSLVKDEDMARKTYSRALTYFLLVTLIAAASLSVFAREVILVLATPIYESSASIVPLLACSAIAWGGVIIVGIGYGIAKKSYHTTIATILAALVNIGLNFLLIPRWNIFGASYFIFPKIRD